MRFHLSEVRSAAYCRRQAYYRLRDEPPEPSPEVRNIKDLAYRYPDVLDSPETVLQETGLHDLDATRIQDGVREARKEYSEWDALARPWRQEIYLQASRLHGTIDKLVKIPTDTGSGRGGDPVYAASLVKTGEPPRNGVWRPTRAEATAAARLVDREFRGAEHVYVEYPRVGEVRRVDLGTRDSRKLESILSDLERAAERVPSRTRNRRKCRSCGYREECGVRTESLLSLLRRTL